MVVFHVSTFILHLQRLVISRFSRSISVICQPLILKNSDSFSKSPGAQDIEDLLLVIAVEILASAGGADVALSTALRCGILPDVVGQTPVDEGDAAAVILLEILEGHVPGLQMILDLDETHN